MLLKILVTRIHSTIESWIRHWDASVQELLIAQPYSLADD